MPNDFERNSDGTLRHQKDRDYAAREARELLAREHREHSAKTGKHISHTQARKFIDKLAGDIDRKG